MTPQEVAEETVKLLQNDFDRLQKLIEEIAKNNLDKMDKRNLGEAYFLIQRLEMEVYRLISLVT